MKARVRFGLATLVFVGFAVWMVWLSGSPWAAASTVAAAPLGYLAGARLDLARRTRKPLPRERRGLAVNLAIVVGMFVVGPFLRSLGPAGLAAEGVGAAFVWGWLAAYFRAGRY